MGTDIHMFVEQKSGDQWSVVGPFECWDCYGTNSKCYTCLGRGSVSDYGIRNYRLFSMLVNVRNGYGFAGTRTGGPIEPIAEPRGIPLDVSTEASEYFDGMHCHDHTWLLLSEILDYDTSRTVECCGVIGIDEYLSRIESGYDGRPPNGFSGDTWGQGLKVVEEPGYRSGEGATHVRVYWRESYQELGRGFFDGFIPAVQSTLSDDPKNIRLVIAFDS